MTDVKVSVEQTPTLLTPQTWQQLDFFVTVHSENNQTVTTLQKYHSIKKKYQALKYYPVTNSTVWGGSHFSPVNAPLVCMCVAVFMYFISLFHFLKDSCGSSDSSKLSATARAFSLTNNLSISMWSSSSY